MFWDENFWENIAIDYISSMAKILTLILLGLGGYEVYAYKNRKKRKNNKKLKIKNN